jgi:hypothetical protein
MKADSACFVLGVLYIRDAFHGFLDIVQHVYINGFLSDSVIEESMFLREKLIKVEFPPNV